MKLRTPKGVMIGELFAFLSGLYFRGKLAYALRFADPPRGVDPALVITTDRGLVAVTEYVTVEALQQMGGVPIDQHDARYREPLEKSVAELAAQIGRRDVDVVLLGSIASGKYVNILAAAFGERLKFPIDFVGRGDMSRGGLMLRCVEEGRELEYAAVVGAVRKGQRPPKLEKRPGILLRAMGEARRARDGGGR